MLPKSNYFTIINACFGINTCCNACGSQETHWSDASVSSTAQSEIEALRFRVSQLQSERDQAVEDAAQIKKEFVNLNETHAQVTIDVLTLPISIIIYACVCDIRRCLS